MKHIQEICDDALRSIENCKNAPTDLISTGFQELDNVIGGFQKSELIILGGRTGMGKTTLALNFAINAAKQIKDQKSCVLFYSFDASVRQLAKNILICLSNVDSFTIRKRTIPDKDLAQMLKCLSTMNELQFFIDVPFGNKLQDLEHSISEQASQQKIGLIIIDCLQFMRFQFPENQHYTRTTEIAEIMQRLKYISNAMSVPIILTTQISRNVEARETNGKRPQLFDLSESAAIEECADIVLFLYRQILYLKQHYEREGTPNYIRWQEKMEEMENVAELIVAKNRYGMLSNVKLHCDLKRMKFTDY